MSKEYKKHGAKQHKGGGKKKVGPAAGPGSVRDAYASGGMSQGMQNVQTQVGGLPPGATLPNQPGGAY